MPITKSFTSREGVKKMDMRPGKVISVVAVGDGATSLKEMLEYIQKIGNRGHSFRIVVDPDVGDYTKEFGWDGDGADSIKSVLMKDE